MSNPRPQPHPENLIPGRKKGAKNLAPWGKQASVKALLAEYVAGHADRVRKAIDAGISAKPPLNLGYLSLAAQYLDTKPAEQVEHTGQVTYHLVLEGMFSTRGGPRGEIIDAEPVRPQLATGASS